MLQHEENWIALAEVLGPRSHWLKPLLERFETPEAIFAAGEEALRAAMPGVGEGLLRQLLTGHSMQSAKQIARWCHRSSVKILPYDGSDYPACLRELEEPPAVLYCRGTLPDLSARAAVGIVGTRRADAYGEQITYKISFELAAAGAVIVSGMAEGIDGIATAAALAAGGTPIAVLGCGIDIAYPRHHQKLMAECAEAGAVLTEYPPGTPPNGYHFPVRNRLISALSHALLVTEAGERSGALITARYAVMQGRTLFVTPGDITAARSQGSNRLLQAGARAALCAEDILALLRPRYHAVLNEDAFREAVQYAALTPEALSAYGVRSVGIADKPQETEKKAKRSKRAPRQERKERPEADPAPAPRTSDLAMLTPRQRELYAMLPTGAFSVDALTERGVPVSEAASTLTMLEIYGLLSARPGGVFERK